MFMIAPQVIEIGEVLRLLLKLNLYQTINNCKKHFVVVWVRKTSRHTNLILEKLRSQTTFCRRATLLYIYLSSSVFLHTVKKHCELCFRCSLVRGIFKKERFCTSKSRINISLVKELKYSTVFKILLVNIILNI